MRKWNIFKEYDTNTFPKSGKCYYVYGLNGDRWGMEISIGISKFVDGRWECEKEINLRGRDNHCCNPVFAWVEIGKNYSETGEGYMTCFEDIPQGTMFYLNGSNECSVYIKTKNFEKDDNCYVNAANLRSGEPEHFNNNDSVIITSARIVLDSEVEEMTYLG